MIQDPQFRFQHHRPGPPHAVGQAHFSLGAEHGVAVEAQPAVIGLVLDRLLGGGAATENGGKSFFCFAQEQPVFAFEVHRTPTLAVLPQFDVAGHIGGGPAQAFQFFAAMGGFLGHPLLNTRVLAA